MDLNTARELARSTVFAACPLVQGDGQIVTSPRITHDVSPVVSIETQAIDLDEAARALYTLTNRIHVCIYAAILPDPDATEDQVCQIASQAVHALRTAGFDVGNTDFTPRNSPWRKLGGTIYRYAVIPIAYDDEYGY